MRHFKASMQKGKSMKTAIIYCSQHHGNTKKLLDAVALMDEVTFIKAKKNMIVDLSDYDRIGFASGIYFWNFNEAVIECAQKNLPNNKEVFLIYTCGVKLPVYSKDMQTIFKKKNCILLGKFACRGYDTFGIFGKMGGIAKNKPSKEDINNFKIFYKNLKRN